MTSWGNNLNAKAKQTVHCHTSATPKAEFSVARVWHYQPQLKGLWLRGRKRQHYLLVILTIGIDAVKSSRRNDRYFAQPKRALVWQQLFTCCVYLKPPPKKKKKKNYPDSFGHCGVTHKAPQQEAVKEEGLSPKKCQSINLF